MSVITPSTVTWEHVKSWKPAEMRQLMKDDAMRAVIMAVVSAQSFEEVQALAASQEKQDQPEPAVLPTPPPVEPTPVVDEAAKAAEAERLAAEAEQQRVAAEEAEKQRLAAETATKQPIVVEYQVRDEKGNPIGRPTKIEAKDQTELIEKMKDAHVHATRAFHRLKQQKVQSLRDINNTPEAPVQPQLSDNELQAALKDLRSEDPATQLAAYKRINATEEAKRKATEAEAKRQKKIHDDALAVSQEFLRIHKDDYNNCEANAKLLEQYFQEQNIPWTLDNLEVALLALEDRLAPVAEPVVTPAAPANPAPAVAPAATTTAVPAVQPVPTVPATPPASVNPTPAARPGVNGGLVPGATSTVRQERKPQGLTIEEILSWDGATMRAKMRSPLRAEIERVTLEAKLRRGR